MDPNNTHEVIFWDNLYKLRPWLINWLKYDDLTIWTISGGRGGRDGGGGGGGYGG